MGNQWCGTCRISCKWADQRSWHCDFSATCLGVLNVARLASLQWNCSDIGAGYHKVWWEVWLFRPVYSDAVNWKSATLSTLSECPKFDCKSCLDCPFTKGRERLTSISQQIVIYFTDLYSVSITFLSEEQLEETLSLVLLEKLRGGKTQIKG